MTMKHWLMMVGVAAACGLAAGCAHKAPMTSAYEPGPVGGKAAGAAVGTAAGNVAGAAVGFGEGVASGVSKSFNPDTHIIRRWKTETTADGRTIQVPEDILVDKYGRPVGPASHPSNP